MRNENLTADAFSALIAEKRHPDLAPVVVKAIAPRVPCVGGRSVSSSYGATFTVGTADGVTFWAEFPEDQATPTTPES